MFDGKCSYINFIHLLGVSYNFDICVDCTSCYISEWPRGSNVIRFLSFPVLFGEVKETVTQK
jgi:hypothetical protein